MDAEEKKLSHKSGADLYPHSQTGFKPHFFPDIPVDNPDSMRVCMPLEEKFRRARYDNGIDCAPLYSDLDNDPSDSSSNSPGHAAVQPYQKGFQDGLEKGQQDAAEAARERSAEKLEPLVNGLQQGLLQLKNLRQDIYQKIENEVVELALAIARKVICREVEMDREVVVGVAREALAKVEDPGTITIKMNPGDLQFINETKYQLSDLIENIENVTLAPEDNVKRGGCVIETNMGEIDARIENQLQAIEDSFRSAVEKSGNVN